MSNERYNQIIGDAYKAYFSKTENITLETLHVPYQNTHLYGTISGAISNAKFRPYTKEEFINKCKTDLDFSQEWGLHIEERELSLEERMNEFLKLGISPSEFRKGGNYGTVIPKERTLEVFDTNNIPTKLITIKYQNETIITYE